MKASSLSDVKKELQELEPRRLVELCLELARYKKDNKEYLGYLLFNAHDKNAFLTELKEDMDAQFAEIEPGTNLYYVKKSLRKILRQVVKYCRYLDDKALAAEAHIYFCLKLKSSGIPFRRNKLIVNLYEQELKKIGTLIATLHPDLQDDYRNDLEKLVI